MFSGVFPSYRSQKGVQIMSIAKAMDALAYSAYSEEAIIALLARRARSQGDGNPGERGFKTAIRDLVAETHPPRGRKAKRVKAVVEELERQRTVRRERRELVSKGEDYYAQRWSRRRWSSSGGAPRPRTIEERRDRVFGYAFQRLIMRYRNLEYNNTLHCHYIRRASDGGLIAVCTGNHERNPVIAHRRPDGSIVAHRLHKRDMSYQYNSIQTLRTKLMGKLPYPNFRLRGGSVVYDLEGLRTIYVHPDGSRVERQWDVITTELAPMPSRRKPLP
jgi:hypothetical protein